MRIVLTHGFPGFVEIELGEIRIRYFNGVKDHLSRVFRDLEILTPTVDPFGPTDQRAKDLDSQLPADGVRAHIIAHSAGGLDARFLVAPPPGLARSDKVASITTISTPHQGSVLADLLTDPVTAAAALASPLGRFRDAVQGLTTKGMAQFNQDIQKANGVQYFSYAGVTGIERGVLGSVFALAYPFVLAKEGPNDGWVSVTSATYGEFKNRIAADHAEVVGHRLSVDFLGLLGVSPFDHLSFFEQIVESLGGVRR